MALELPMLSQRMRVLRIPLIIVLLALDASSQLRFDAASVRPSHAACQGRSDFSPSHGALTVENVALLGIISRAYGLTDDRVSGPAWLDSECYDIHAKASNNVPDRDLMQMLQPLLKERFHLIALWR
jgi:uncharacterized protein (TIGR03435 family)